MLDILFGFDWFGDDDIIRRTSQTHFFCTKNHKCAPLTVIVSRVHLHFSEGLDTNISIIVPRCGSLNDARTFF